MLPQPVVAYALLAISVSTASAQVPAELALALVPSMQLRGEPPPRLVVGQIPDAVPVTVLLPGSEILGGLESARRSIAAFRVPMEIRSAEGVEAAIVANLVESGWQTTDPFDSVFGRREPTRSLPMVCLEDRILRVSVQPGGADHLVRIEVERAAPGRGPCGDVAEHLSLDLSLPELTAPEGAVISPSVQSGGPGVVEARAHVATTVRPDALVEHYADRFVAAGWSSVERSGSETAAHQRFTMREADGNEVNAIVTVAKLPGLEEMILVVRAQRLSGERPGIDRRFPGTLEIR